MNRCLSSCGLVNWESERSVGNKDRMMFNKCSWSQSLRLINLINAMGADNLSMTVRQMTPTWLVIFALNLSLFLSSFPHPRVPTAPYLKVLRVGPLLGSEVARYIFIPLALSFWLGSSGHQGGVEAELWLHRPVLPTINSILAKNTPLFLFISGRDILKL